MGLKKIVLITTGQPGTNPRIVKEAEALQLGGFEVTVLYSFFISWASEADKKILNGVAWRYKILGGSPFQNKGLYLFTRLRFKFSSFFIKHFGNKFLFPERAQARAYDELIIAAKEIKADWYIGHNLGALAVAVKAAKFNNAKAGFDFEDYHRGESNIDSERENSLVVYLENKYIPLLDYLSAASSMIADKVVKHFPSQIKNIITLRNCFPLAQQQVFRVKLSGDNTLQLFWFSQTIGLDRGLEILLEAMSQINDCNIHLTLAGRCNQDFKEYLDKYSESLKNQIHFAGIIAPEELPSFASKFDVGLALELSRPENRNICLTNKMFTYLLAGNAIIFSDTAMQENFNDEYKIGEGFEIDDVNGLIKAIQKFTDKNLLDQQRKHNYNLAKNELNWEVESKGLTNFFDKN